MFGERSLRGRDGNEGGREWLRRGKGDKQGGCKRKIRWDKRERKTREGRKRRKEEGEKKINR